jgi:hypothetical protein
MKVAQQFGSSAHIFLGHRLFLLFDVCFERSNFGGRDVAHKFTGHLYFQHAPHAEDLLGFVGRRCRHKGAAGRFHANETVLGQLKQGLPDQGARDSKVSG